MLADALVLASQQPDVSLSGRVHETFKQYHAGVPVYGGGISRQLANNGLTVSIFGTIHQGIDLDMMPRLAQNEALALLEQRAGAGPATDDPPTLVILPTPFDTYVLAYRATMRDFRTYFVDAHSGAIVHVENEVDEQGAVGSGFGIQNDLKKVSVSPVGGGFQTYDRLRPAEIVTLDLRHADARVDSLLDPRGARWAASDVAWDADNDWRDQAVVGAHVYGGFTYDYLFAQQGWSGMNGRDGRILSMVNIGRAGENNAFFYSSPVWPGRDWRGRVWHRTGRHAHRVGRCRRARDDARRDAFFGCVAHRKRSARHPRVRSRAVEFHLRRTDIPLR